jgi:hypothetical protein
MPWPSVDEFKEILKTRAPEDVVREYVFGEGAFAFENKPKSLEIIFEHLTSNLPIQKHEVIIVGSAKLGFSLNPDGYFNPFTKASDIDIIVVNTELFDRIWMICLDWHYLSRYGERMSRPSEDWAAERKKEVYWGWFKPDQIKFPEIAFGSALRELRDIKHQWFSTFQSFSRFPEFASRTINNRLYRSIEHAARYHRKGLVDLREFLNSIGNK